MLKSTRNAIGIIITGLFLAACSHQTAPATTPQTSPAPTTTASDVTPTPKPLTPQSSGNAQEDMAEIEAAIDNLDIEADFPAFTADNL